MASPRRSSQQRQTSPQRGTQVRKKLSLNPQQRGKESEVNLLAAWPAAPATTKDGRGGASTRAGEEEEEELTELDAAMNALHDEKEEAAISEEEQAITWRGEPVASDDLHGITYRDQFALEPKGTGTFAQSPLLVAAVLPTDTVPRCGTVFRVGDCFRCATKRQGAEDDDYLEATMPVDASSEEQPSICTLHGVLLVASAVVYDMAVQSHTRQAVFPMGRLARQAVGSV